ncbi:MAG TPA: GDSL-type esterase/lipase family protein [Chthoniobacter sp.]|jgi:hypothetical protein
MRFPLLCLLVVLFLGRASAGEPFLKKGDVVAIVGGEDMVALSDYGYLEMLLHRALPDYHLRFRNLAWEGDTVFDQRRDLNFPSWEEQLDKIGATVVICQFGQTESLAGRSEQNLPEFVAAYWKLLERFRAGGKRRLVIIPPTPVWRITPISEAAEQRRSDDVNGYALAAQDLAKKEGFRFAEVYIQDENQMRHDGIHLSPRGLFQMGFDIASALGPADAVTDAAAEQPKGAHSLVMPKMDDAGHLDSPEREKLRQSIVAKNKLWFNYWRPQNWAFLFGDRTNQPSSRDWRDPSKRWFPAEREEFVPLIEAKEKEIDALAEKLK